MPQQIVFGTQEFSALRAFTRANDQSHREERGLLQGRTIIFAIEKNKYGDEEIEVYEMVIERKVVLFVATRSVHKQTLPVYELSMMSGNSGEVTEILMHVKREVGDHHDYRHAP